MHMDPNNLAWKLQHMKMCFKFPDCFVLLEMSLCILHLFPNEKIENFPKQF